MNTNDAQTSLNLGISRSQPLTGLSAGRGNGLTSGGVQTTGYLNLTPKQTPCPCCGRCPTCGHTPAAPAPFVPHTPYVPYMPSYQQNPYPITCSNINASTTPTQAFQAMN